MPGPLPTGNARRRNKPTIPTSSLPASGFTGGEPDLPPGNDLGEAGMAWWSWAWRTPQAAAWADGHEVTVARRASLEDDLAALFAVEGLDFDALAEAANAKAFLDTVRRVAALATGRLQLLKEMRELDDRLGLSPKAMAQLRWNVVDDAAKTTASKSSGNVVTPDRWQTA